MNAHAGSATLLKRSLEILAAKRSTDYTYHWRTKLHVCMHLQFYPQLALRELLEFLTTHHGALSRHLTRRCFRKEETLHCLDLVQCRWKAWSKDCGNNSCFQFNYFSPAFPGFRVPVSCCITRMRALIHVLDPTWSANWLEAQVGALNMRELIEVPSYLFPTGGCSLRATWHIP